MVAGTVLDAVGQWRRCFDAVAVSGTGVGLFFDAGSDCGLVMAAPDCTPWAYFGAFGAAMLGRCLFSAARLHGPPLLPCCRGA